MQQKRPLWAGLARSFALTASACGNNGTAPTAPTAAHDHARQATAVPAGEATATAVDLRTQLNALLSEHVALASAATGAAAGGRDAEFKAAADALDGNSTDLATLIGSAYGPDAEAVFLQGWRNHIGFFVDYTQGTAARDNAKRDKALADLNQYAADLATFLNTANGMPVAETIALLKAHVVGLTAVIDAQIAGDQPRVYGELRKATAHMHMFGDPLAAATVQKFPAKFARS